MSNPMMKFTAEERRRACQVALFPCMAQMNATVLRQMRCNPEAVRTMHSMLEDRAPELLTPEMKAAGVQDAYDVYGWNALARAPMKQWFDQLAPLNMFSTTYSEELKPVSADGLVPEKIGAHVYDRNAVADVDNYNDFSTRAKGSMRYVELSTHKVDCPIKVNAQDLAAGVNWRTLLEMALSVVANGVQKAVFNDIKVGTAQYGGGGTVQALTVPAVDTFDFAYVQKTLTEHPDLQPRLNGLALNSAYYGALKAGTREDFRPEDVDADWVGKVQGLDALKGTAGSEIVGLAGNKGGAAIAMAGGMFMQGAYSSVQQLTYDGNAAPIAIATFFMADKNMMVAVPCTLVGAVVVDAKQVKPLIATA